MKFNILAGLFAGVASLMAPASHAKRAVMDKPNLLIVVTDEHSLRTLTIYKELLIERGQPERANPWGVIDGFCTPHIDRIGHEGAVLTSMYASAPSCAPSRSSMFTGNFPHTAGVPTNGNGIAEDSQTIAKVLRKVGYKTGYAGKWHLEEGDPQPGWSPAKSFHGFDDNRYMFNSGHWKQLGFEADGTTGCVPIKNGKKAVQSATEKTYTTDWLTDRALEFIEENQEDPFLYVLSIPDPHTPDTVRAPYDTMYDPAAFHMPESFTTTGMRDDFYPHWIRTKQRLPEGTTAESMLPKVAQYHGMVKCIDDNVGRILSKLESTGILDDTIVVFSADHGEMFGEFGHQNKGVPYEGSACIPFVIRYPKRIAAGTVVDKAANTADWMDTFLSLMQVGASDFDPSTTEGRNVAPLLTGGGADFEDMTISRFQTWAAAITDRYKLIFDTSKTQPWLIDLELNPGESRNYIDDPGHRAVAVKLAKELLAYGHRTKDDLVTVKLEPQIQKIIKR
ncbi:sulfatase-like hydrolase/transferase [Pontiella agarivorans]|uniref:Sulfatase-like hydrolase/transferase n=1 Tax=Pontiella agarivorans TaxID=3038953 RepID=A0ABU5MS14_9BACT|nr:sulfatase-like hydrolase/transferase [Pontiella agarivorans]MDZ8117000.1 sulfatase-like hydrolase/transferase [Pontiella agarivorans]